MLKLLNTVFFIGVVATYGMGLAELLALLGEFSSSLIWLKLLLPLFWFAGSFLLMFWCFNQGKESEPLEVMGLGLACSFYFTIPLQVIGFISLGIGNITMFFSLWTGTEAQFWFWLSSVTIWVAALATIPMGFAASLVEQSRPKAVPDAGGAPPAFRRSFLGFLAALALFAGLSWQWGGLPRVQDSLPTLRLTFFSWLAVLSFVQMLVVAWVQGLTWEFLVGTSRKPLESAA